MLHPTISIEEGVRSPSETEVTINLTVCMLICHHTEGVNSLFKSKQLAERKPRPAYKLVVLAERKPRPADKLEESAEHKPRPGGKLIVLAEHKPRPADKIEFAERK
jgi:hypothetical protein